MRRLSSAASALVRLASLRAHALVGLASLRAFALVRLVVLAAPALALLAALPASARQVDHSGTLGRLVLPQDGRLVHYSSADPTGGNNDRVGIAPGETFTLLDHQGGGEIRRWWVTIAPRNNREIQRQLIVRCYWDGEETPSVEVPVSDFFGMGFGEWKDFQSLPLNMTSGGYNSYWPMPFKRSARVTVENRSAVPVGSFYYNVDIRTYGRDPGDVLFFHAQYRQARTEAGEPVTLLEATGRGHYVGSLISMIPERGNGIHYLEGDERVFVDGEAEPSIVGTGSEDYFSSGWYYDTGEYSALYHGVTIKDTDRGRINTYRWHIEDPIPFTRSLRFTIEHGGRNDYPGVEYATVAFWYQTHPHGAFATLPADLLPLSTASAPDIEGESLVPSATVTGGRIEVQDMTGWGSTWSGAAHLWWLGQEPGDRMTLRLEAPAAGAYELIAFMTRAPDYGIVRLHLNGRPIEPLFDGYARRVESSGPVPFGTHALRAGTNELVFELLGKDERSAGYMDGYMVGIDGFVLRPAR